MKQSIINPYSLRITDPLFELDKRRPIILDLIENNKIKPIFYMFDGEYNLVFNGNKRTVISREIFRPILANLITDDLDLFSAQESDPRKFPLELEFNYNSILLHLRERAEKYGRLNISCPPIDRSLAERIISGSLARQQVNAYAE